MDVEALADAIRRAHERDDVGPPRPALRSRRYRRVRGALPGYAHRHAREMSGAAVEERWHVLAGQLTPVVR